MRRGVKLGLALAGVALAGLAAYSWQRGLRYPPLQFDPQPLPESGFSALGWRVHAVGAYFRDQAEGLLAFRAYAPEPAFTAEGTRGGTVKLIVENVHPEADLVLPEGLEPAAVRAETLGLERQIEFELEFGAVRRFAFRFPERARYRFAAIGDAGGAGELDWCFARAGELGADFVLHLGDIGYRETDMADAIDAFRTAPVPVYAAVGNHDFHGGHRYRYRIFQREFGPLNSSFTLGGVAFLNLDTAADLIPPSRGQRGRLLREYRPPPGAPVIVFTHRPLEDPRLLEGRRDKAHAMNRAWEKDFLYEAIAELQAAALLAGHIHASFDFTHRGLRTLIAGDGLGQRGDVARILIGEFGPGASPEFRWEPLAMPEQLRGRDLQPAADPDNE